MTLFRCQCHIDFRFYVSTSQLSTVLSVDTLIYTSLCRAIAPITTTGFCIQVPDNGRSLGVSKISDSDQTMFQYKWTGNIRYYFIGTELLYRATQHIMAIHFFDCCDETSIDMLYTRVQTKSIFHQSGYSMWSYILKE